MELPTYTNIWKIEKRLYKLYDFRLPMPLPIGQVAAFLAIAVPYMLLLTLAGMPFSHTWVWLYVLPPGLLTWLVTRPVLEGKRLPELVLSQVRYLSEPRTWCRMAPFTEDEQILVTARVWRQSRRPDSAMALASAADGAGGEGGSREFAPLRLRPQVASERVAPIGYDTGRAWPSRGRSSRGWPSRGRPGRRSDEQVPEEQPVEEQPVEEQPVEEQPVEEQPVEEQPVEELAAEEAATPEVDEHERPEAERVRVRGVAVAPHEAPSPAAATEPDRADEVEQAADTQAAAVRPSWPSHPAMSPHAVDFTGGGLSGDVQADAQAAAEEADIEDVAEAAAGSESSMAPAEVASAADVVETDAVAEPEPESPMMAPAELASAVDVAETGATAEPEPPAEVASAADVVETDAVAEPEPEPKAESESSALAESTVDVAEAGATAEPEPPAEVASAADVVETDAVAEPEAEPEPSMALAEVASAVDIPEADTAIADPAIAHPAVTITTPGGALEPLHVVERALRTSAGTAGWRDRVVVVPGGHRPGRPDQVQRDQARARLPLAGPARIVVIGCTAGAGQTTTTLLAGQLMASLRAEPVAVFDLAAGPGSLTDLARQIPRLVPGRVTGTASGHITGQATGTASGHITGHTAPGSVTPRGLQVITADEDNTADAGSLIDTVVARYPLMLADPAAVHVPRAVKAADQLVLVAPAGGNAAGALAMTLEWLDAHGNADVTSAAVVVLNGVSAHTEVHVDKAAAVATGRCRAIVRVPWDTAHAGTGSLSVASVQAYTALAGVLVAGLSSRTTTIPGAGEPVR